MIIKGLCHSKVSIASDVMLLKWRLKKENGA